MEEGEGGLAGVELEGDWREREGRRFFSSSRLAKQMDVVDECVGDGSCRLRNELRVLDAQGVALLVEASQTSPVSLH